MLTPVRRGAESPLVPQAVQEDYKAAMGGEHNHRAD